MRLCRFDANRLGVVDGGHVRDVTAALDVLPACLVAGIQADEVQAKHRRFVTAHLRASNRDDIEKARLEDARRPAPSEAGV